MDAFFATIPTHFFYIFQVLKQDKIENCDLYYTNVTRDAEEIVERIKQLNVFHNVYLLPNISIEYPIRLRRCVDISIKKWEVLKLLADKKYENVYFNVDGWLYNSIIYNGLHGKNRNFKSIFVENGVNPYITSYDSKEWYLRLFINLNGLVCMDGKYIDERYVLEPSMIGVKQSGLIKKLNKIDRNDEFIKNNLNKIFGYDKTLDSFSQSDTIIMEQAPRREYIDMYSLWERVGTKINKEKTVVKPHPRQLDSALKKLGFKTYDRFTIPWELSVLNENMENKTIISTFSTTCIAPKLMFGQEPRVIMLYKLLGRDYSFFGEGMLAFVEKVKNSYVNKDKFFVPETWEEFDYYCERFMGQN